MLRDSLHDGIKLSRAFRRAGFRTDLFDATHIATCRMYHSNLETWRGLGKNATEGLAAPGRILPMTALLLGGQAFAVCPARLRPHAFLTWLDARRLRYCHCMRVPRLTATRTFRQPLGAAFLHPLGVLVLLAIQWHALVRHFSGKPSVWKGRPIRSCLLSNRPNQLEEHIL